MHFLGVSSVLIFVFLNYSQTYWRKNNIEMKLTYIPDQDGCRLRGAYPLLLNLVRNSLVGSIVRDSTFFQ